MRAAFSDPATGFWVNRAAFTTPAAFTSGNAAQAYTGLRAPCFFTESPGLIKRTRLTGKALLTFRAEFFNVLNRTVLSGPDSNVNNLQFGRISAQANSPRRDQLALRLEF